MLPETGIITGNDRKRKNGKIVEAGKDKKRKKIEAKKRNKK